jgi:aminopeptidase
MQDPRIRRLAEVLVDHSCQIKAGDKVLIEAFDLPETQLVCDLVELAAERGAVPLVSWKNNSILRTLYAHGTREGLSLIGDLERERMAQMDAYIGIRGAANSNEFSDVPRAQMDLYQELWWKPVHIDVRVPKTRWVVLRYPTPSFAQAAKMSVQAFEDFYFAVCTADYARMAKNQEPLRERMLACDRVRLTGPGTDLAFSIKGIPVIACNGDRNIPDGEVFTAPVRNSINGTISYNAASIYQGTVFEGVRFTFKDGKIIEATCTNEPEKLNSILDSDEGARYIGEFAIGCNNFIRRPMLDILFDEKIGGSIHLTPGNAYETADNGNRSRVHWDLVFIQTPEYGGGEIHFDGEVIRRDGRFLPQDLQPLNEGL